ncbi:MAG: hypothetical protein ACM3WT_00590 [Bacillota bacterium]
MSWREVVSLLMAVLLGAVPALLLSGRLAVTVTGRYKRLPRVRCAVARLTIRVVLRVNREAAGRKSADHEAGEGDKPLEHTHRTESHREVSRRTHRRNVHRFRKRSKDGAA